MVPSLLSVRQRIATPEVPAIEKPTTTELVGQFAPRYVSPPPPPPQEGLSVGDDNKFACAIGAEVTTETGRVINRPANRA